jgi:L-amino acid N-acyltransferase YncA
MPIRHALPTDAQAIVDIYSPYVVSSAISFEVEAPGCDEMARRIQSRLGVLPWLVSDEGGVVQGYAYAAPHGERAAYRWSVDVSVYVAASARRCGVGNALYGRLFSILEAQGYFNAYAGIALPNEPSCGLHEAMGFRPVGVYERVGFKFGRWHDVGWWQLRLRESSGDPSDPVPLAQLKPSL